MTKIEPIYQEVASKIYKDENKALPKVLKKIANLRQAKIMRELPATAEEFTKKLAPTTAEEIAKKLALSKATVAKDLQYLFERGLVNSGRNGYNIIFASLIGLKDGVASANAKYDDNEVFDLLVQMSLEYPKSLPGRIKRGEKIPPVRQAMRVVPKWRTIKDIPGVLPIEDVRQIFKNNPPIVVHRCPCRVAMRNRPCKDKVPDDVCLGTGPAGRRTLRRGTGAKELTYDELLAFLDKMDKFSVVTMTGNTDRMPTGICSCCNDCCGMFVRSSYIKPLLGQHPFAKSRFVVEDNPKKCRACGLCAKKRCPVGAITMKDFPKLGGKRSYTNVEECIGCGLCVLTCPNEARKMKLVRPPKHIPEAAPVSDDVT